MLASSAWLDNDLKEFLAFDCRGIFLPCSKPHLRILLQQLKHSESSGGESLHWDTQPSHNVKYSMISGVLT